MSNQEDLTDDLGNNHIGTNEQTPLRNDAFEKSEEESL